MQIDITKALEELKWLGLAVSTDSTRFNICRLHVDDKRAVATDGHRMHFVEGSCLPAGFSLRGHEVTLLLEISKNYMPHTAELRDGSTYWKFVSGEGTVELTFEISEYRFPEYARLIPAETEATEVVTKEVRKVYVGNAAKPDYNVVGPGHFNARYIAEALRGAPKRVTAVLPDGKDSPVLFRYENRGAVVMPVRQ